MSEVKAGTILVANEQVLAGDPTFGKSVILILSNAENTGTIGVDIAVARGEHQLYESGPLDLPIPLILQKAAADTPYMTDRGLGKIGDSGCEVAPPPDTVEQFRADVADPDKMVLVGYAGWGAGQLAMEIEMGAWAISPVSVDTILKTPTADRHKVASQGAKFATDAPV